MTCGVAYRGGSRLSNLTGYSLVWLKRVIWDHETAGSNPATQTSVRVMVAACLAVVVAVSGKTKGATASIRWGRGKRTKRQR